MAKIISVLSQKGGTGKSTVARIAAVAYAQAGWTTVVIDADTSQLTTKEWSDRRVIHPKHDDSEALWVFKADGANPVKRLLAKHHPDLVVIDGAPHATDSSVMFAKQSDLILIPTGVAIDDLQPAIKLAIQLVSVHGVERERIRFVLNHCSRNKREINQAIEAILGSGLKVIGAFLNESPCYRSAMDFGKAPNEVPYAIPKSRAIHLAESIADALNAAEEIV